MTNLRLQLHLPGANELTREWDSGSQYDYTELLAPNFLYILWD